MISKVKWNIEVVEFSKNSPALLIRVTGTAENGKKCSKDITVFGPEFPHSSADVYAEWSE